MISTIISNYKYYADSFGAILSDKYIQDPQSSIRLRPYYLGMSFNSKLMLLGNNMRRSNRGGNMLIIIGVVGLIVAVVVGILIFRAIFD
jgi:hypothetical protein